MSHPEPGHKFIQIVRREPPACRNHWKSGKHFHMGGGKLIRERGFYVMKDGKRFFTTRHYFEEDLGTCFCCGSKRDHPVHNPPHWHMKGQRHGTAP